MPFLGIPRFKSRTSKTEGISRGKVRIPRGSIFFFCVFCITEQFFSSGISRPSVLFREKVNTTWTRCAPGLHSQVPVSSLHSGPPEGGRLAAEHIMPELFRATGSLNFRIRPRSFALGRSLTASKPTEEEKGICLPCGSIVTIRMLPSTVTMTCGWMHSPPPPSTLRWPRQRLRRKHTRLFS